MRHLDEFINEAKTTYELPEDFEEKTKSILDSLIKCLPSYPGYKPAGHGIGDMGAFAYNPYDTIRFKTESAKYIGMYENVFMQFDTKTNSQIDISKLKSAFNVIFGANININEGVFDNNINKKMPEYEWVSKLYSGLCEFFKTNKITGISFKEKWGEYQASVYKELKNCPTVEIGEYIVSLRSIAVEHISPDYKYQSIKLQVYVYLNKDPEKVASIKAANDAIKPYDVMNRELKEGDLVAYVHIDSYGRLGGMRTGKIVGVSKDQVKLDINKRIRSDRTCLIARKDGKMIE